MGIAFAAPETPQEFGELCGWDDEPIKAGAADRFQETLPYQAANPVTDEKRDVFLWKPMRELLPNWRRGRQRIGDCVSWGAELAVTMKMAISYKMGIHQFLGEAATEPIYGGSRVEARGRTSGGWSDGSYGAAAADWLRKWGVLLRIDYSKETGVAEHDLRQYSGEKAKQWGNYGCGGQNDKQKLDAVAKLRPIKEVTRVTSTDQLANLLMSGYTVTVASGVGYGSMRRDSTGVVRRSGSWAHQMMFGGVRWVNGRPQFRQFQSWGDSCVGPDPGIDDDAISACSWWTTEEDAAVQIRGGDTWAVSAADGFPPVRLPFAEAFGTWGLAV